MHKYFFYVHSFSQVKKFTRAAAAVGLTKQIAAVKVALAKARAQPAKALDKKLDIAIENRKAKAAVAHKAQIALNRASSKVEKAAAALRQVEVVLKAAQKANNVLAIKAQTKTISVLKVAPLCGLVFMCCI